MLPAEPAFPCGDDNNTTQHNTSGFGLWIFPAGGGPGSAFGMWIYIGFQLYLWNLRMGKAWKNPLRNLKEIEKRKQRNCEQTSEQRGITITKTTNTHDSAH